MSQRTHRLVRAAPPALVGVLLALAPAAATAATTSPAAASPPTTSPLPASNYRARPVCRAPRPGQASCLALELVPETAAARARTHPLGIVRATPLRTPTAAEGAYGLRPEDLRTAYFPGEPSKTPASEPQTIALVDAYNDVNAESDLATYGQTFKSKLPPLTVCSSPTAVEPGCFEKVDQEGSTAVEALPFPRTAKEAAEAKTFCAERKEGSEPLEEWLEKEATCELVREAEGWSLETSLDIEMAHAVCQNCRIVLVEANSPEDTNLETAENTAVALGATEVSNSWGGVEPEPEHGQSKALDSPAYEHPGVVITAAAGDSGYLNWTEAEEARALRESYNAGAEYPASSPHVVAVGGTSLTLGRVGTWQSESAWNDDHEPTEANNGAGGSGCSLRFEAQPWQQGVPDWSAVGCEDRRAVADVSADGDPYTGVAVYDSDTYCEYRYEEAKKTYIIREHWCTVGGTSVSTPVIAAMFALAGGAHGVPYPAQTLYEHLETDLLHEVPGSNGECDGDYVSGCSGSMSPLSSRFAFDCGAGTLICNSGPDCVGWYYDGPTGVGSPNGIGAFKPEEHPAKDAPACTGNNSGSGSHSGSGNGGGSGNESGNVSGSGVGSGPTQPTTGAGEGQTPSGPSGGSHTPRAHPLLPILSGLTLTRTATAALSHGKPKAAALAFAFTLNVAARVRVTLARQLIVHGHARWQTLPYSLTIAAAQGHDSARLSAHARLAAGRYRLTLTPAGGAARTLTFRVG